MSTNIKELENRVEYVRQESTACRGEVCRTLESEADDLSLEIEHAFIAGTISAGEEEVLSEKLRYAYNHLSA
ncbi:MAG: hypothetical protein P8130_00315 [Deltaproteobacteria bacterium]